MRTDQRDPEIRLSDYRVPDYLVRQVDLTFRLAPKTTEVVSRITFYPNPARAEGPADLVLNGNGLEIEAVSINGSPLPREALSTGDEKLTVASAHVPQEEFVWEATNTIAPIDNTSLDGLYMSNGMYCTQCEAQGFRKITWFPDRPDVMATYKVRIEGDAPVLLSNGNLVGQGDGWAEWEDPHPKPSYLFALVAGELEAFEDRFTTMSGRDVLLQIWVRPGDLERCEYAMDALKRSMRWDEEVYGREYDLDRFMVVAVDDFNMGAMENKGLNIFNSKYVLASPETATDTDYANIEAIIAHEYFHNWTGNRITCRDWFQLCLKEGLTVYRDQQFSGDMRSHGVKRIEDVIRLRSQQFSEDAGPLAHPVRPEKYIEINNFYTATVYEKGAEIIGMLRGLVGEETWKKALDLYFERHDGEACTIEDWLKVFEDASGRDLSHFGKWYSQAGTPRVRVSEDYQDGTYRLTLSQETRPTPGQPNKEPLVIPVAYGLIGHNGVDTESGVLELASAEETFEWTLPEKPRASLMRGFSAPVILEQGLTAAERSFHLAHDVDPFNRWEAGHAHALDLLGRMSQDAGVEPEAEYLEALCVVADDPQPDPAFRALALGLPTVQNVISDMAANELVPDPLAIHEARTRLKKTIAETLGDRPERMYAENAVAGPYTPDATAAGHRALRARCLDFMTVLDPEAKAAAAQFDAADNMTERVGALTQLVAAGRGEDALARFYEDWRQDRLVMDKWFAVQATATPPEAAVATVERLTGHPDFDWKNPNRLRSLIASFAGGNAAGFHRPDGSGYRLLMDWLIRLDPVNPQTTARLTSLVGNWKIFDGQRQALIRTELERLASLDGLSKNTAEMVGRLLAED